VAIVNGLVLTSSDIGTQFTILSSTGTLSGSFTNSTVTVGTDVFSVSYVGNTVVLTLTSVTGPTGSKTPAKSAASAPATVRTSAKAGSVKAGTISRSPILSASQRQRVSGSGARPIMVVGLEPSKARSAGPNPVFSGERVPAFEANVARPVVAVQSAREGSESSRVNVPASDLRMGGNRAIGTPSSMAGWMNSNRRTPVKIMQPMISRIAR